MMTLSALSLIAVISSVGGLGAAGRPAVLFGIRDVGRQKILGREIEERCGLGA